MLKPAVLYKEEIQTKMLEYNYTEDMMYYSGHLGNALPSIEADTNGKLYQYAIVNDGKLIGYFTYQVDWYNSCVYNFGLYSFILLIADITNTVSNHGPFLTLWCLACILSLLLYDFSYNFFVIFSFYSCNIYLNKY